MARTPSKSGQFQEFVLSSPKDLLSMYEYTKRKHEELKDEVKLFMKRLLFHCTPQSLSNVILDEDPLHRIYEFFVEAHKVKEIPVIVLSDSTVRDQESGGGGGRGGRGGGGGGGEGDMEDNVQDGGGGHEELKDEVKLFMKRLLFHCTPQSLSNVILDEDPLHRIYEFFVEAHKVKEILVIVLSDSTVRDQESGGGGGRGGRGGRGGVGGGSGDMEDNVQDGGGGGGGGELE